MFSLMKPLLLLLLFTCALFPDKLMGLKCKQGFEARHGGEIETENGECLDKEGAQYCLAAICTIEEAPNLPIIFWKCDTEKDTQYCASFAADGLQLTTGSKNVTCMCHYGEKGEDFGNEQFTLPPVPSTTDDNEHEKTLSCKGGNIDAKKRGRVEKMTCFKGSNFCFAAKCTKNDEHFLLFWGCSINDNDDECKRQETQLGNSLNTKLSCQCHFGSRNGNFSNERMLLSQLFPQKSNDTGAGGTPIVSPAMIHSTMATSSSTGWDGTGEANDETPQNHSRRSPIAKLLLLTVVLLILGIHIV